MLSVGNQYETYEYYAKDPVYSVADGQFIGGLAAELGFNEMNADNLAKLQGGQDAAGNQVIELSKQGEHNPGKDFSFSIDKSFSIARFAENTPQWFKDAHDAAMQKAAETFLKTAVEAGMITYRNTIDGKQVHTAITGVNQLAANSFLHSTSRENDPQSHAHVAVFNMAKVGDDYKAIKFDGVFTKDGRAMLDQAAKNAYVQELQQLAGIDLKPFMDVNKKTGEITLKAFDKETLEKYSTRSQEINAYLEKNGLDRTGHATQIAALATRDEKSMDFTKEQLEEKLKPEAEKIEELFNNGLNVSHQYGVYEKPDVSAELKNAVSVQIEALSKNEIFNNVNTLYKEVLKENKEFTYQAVRAEFESRIGPELTVRNVTDHKGTEIRQFATKENIAAERFVQGVIADGKDKGFAVDSGKLRESVAAFEKKAGFKLSVEQKKAITEAFNSKDKVSIIEGVAGAGKTTLFKAVNESMKANGVDVWGLSNTGAAALNLQKETGIKTQTLKEFIVSSKVGVKTSTPTVFVIDETSQGGVKDMKDAIEAIEKAGYTNYKIALTGDTRQIQSISGGNVLKNAVKTDASRAALKDIQRQKNAELKGAILNYYKEFDKGKINGKEMTDKLADKGFIKTAEKGNELKTAVGIYRDYEKQGSVVLLVRTRADMAEGNRLIRDDKIINGELGRTAHNVSTYEKVNVAETDRRRSESYEKGDAVSWKNGQYHEITKVDHAGNSIEVRSLNTVKIGENAYFNGDKISVAQKDSSRKEYDLKAVNGKLATFYGQEKTINLSDLKNKNIDVMQKYSVKGLELRNGDKVIFTQNIKGVSAVRETIKYDKANNSKVYSALKMFNATNSRGQGFRATDFYKAIKVFNKAVDWVGVKINNNRVDKAEAKALAKGEQYSKWEFNGNKGIAVTHSQEIKNNMTAIFTDKKGDTYNFKLESGEKISLNINNDKDRQALSSLQHGYAITTDRAQGNTYDRAVSVGNAEKTANQNLVDMTRGRHDYTAVVSEKDMERTKDENGNELNSKLDNALANEQEKTTSIEQGAEPVREQEFANERESGQEQELGDRLESLPEISSENTESRDVDGVDREQEPAHEQETERSL